jgi:hypothetical protein
VAEKLDDLTPWLGQLSEDAWLNEADAEGKETAGPKPPVYRTFPKTPADVMPKGRNFH